MLLALMSHETLLLYFLMPEQNTYTDPKACLLQIASEYIIFSKCGANLARQNSPWATTPFASLLLLMLSSLISIVIVIVFGYIIEKTL